MPGLVKSVLIENLRWFGPAANVTTISIYMDLFQRSCWKLKIERRYHQMSWVVILHLHRNYEKHFLCGHNGLYLL